MHEIKITVEIPGLPEVINNLAEALRAGQACTCNQTGANNQPNGSADNANIDHTPVKNPAPVAQENPTIPAPTPTNLAPADPASAVLTGPATASSPSEGRSYTLDDLSNAGAALIDQGKMTQLCDLLEKYGVQAVTQLPAESYPAFVADLKALGAQL